MYQLGQNDQNRTIRIERSDKVGPPQPRCKVTDIITGLGGNPVGVACDPVNVRMYVLNFDDSIPLVIISVNPI